MVYLDHQGPLDHRAPLDYRDPVGLRGRQENQDLRGLLDIKAFQGKKDLEGLTEQEDFREPRGEQGQWVSTALGVHLVFVAQQVLRVHQDTMRRSQAVEDPVYMAPPARQGAPEPGIGVCVNTKTRGSPHKRQECQQIL